MAELTRKADADVAELRRDWYNPGMTDSPQQPDGNFDEDRVPAYALPDPLRTAGGGAITSSSEWEARRRPELLDLFRRHVYGRVPEATKAVRIEVEHQETFDMSDGAARTTQYRMLLTSGRGTLPIDVLAVLPRESEERPAPVVTALNFRGNHTVCDDPRVRITGSWIPPDTGVEMNHGTEAGRGTRASRWPLDLIVGAGMGLVTVYCGDLDPDYDDGFANGVHGLVESPRDRDEESWGTIGGWAWGLSRLADLLQDDPRVDSSRIAVLGHSRLGKTALWAAAQDERFAAAISNESGCGGAAISRREYGETVRAITSRFPHWFCSTFADYAGRAHELPVDQHELIALLAPRPAQVGSAEDDRWSDPYGEYLAVRHAAPVYRLYGYETVESESMPGTGAVAGARVGYHCRAGGHDLAREDWQVYLDALTSLWR